MKKFILYIFVILLAGACKSKAPPRTADPQPIAQPGSSSTPATTQPVSTTPPPVTTQPVSTIPSPGVTQPAQTPIPPVSQPPVTIDPNIGSRYQNNVILDGAVSYTVKEGDTLSGIARQFYQDGSYYPLIMMASGGISDIDLIYPNMKFTIPNLRANMDSQAAKADINSFFLQIAQIEDQRGRRATAAMIRNHIR